jgi:hypothetical protein
MALADVRTPNFENFQNFPQIPRPAVTFSVGSLQDRRLFCSREAFPLFSETMVGTVTNDFMPTYCQSREEATFLLILL